MHFHIKWYDADEEPEKDLLVNRYTIMRKIIQDRIVRLSAYSIYVHEDAEKIHCPYKRGGHCSKQCYFTLQKGYLKIGNKALKADGHYECSGSDDEITTDTGTLLSVVIHHGSRKQKHQATA